MGKFTMHAKDTIQGSMAELYCTIEGNRYNIAQAKSFEATFELNKTELGILGRTGKGNKPTGWKGTGSMTLYYNTSLLRELAYRYKETGEVVYFDLQCTNEDTASSVGRQTVTFKDCNFDSLILATFDVDDAILEEDVDFTFEDFEIPEKFTLLTGMI